MNNPHLGKFYQGCGFDPEERELLEKAFTCLSAQPAEAGVTAMSSENKTLAIGECVKSAVLDTPMEWVDYEQVIDSLAVNTFLGRWKDYDENGDRISFCVMNDDGDIFAAAWPDEDNTPPSWVPSDPDQILVPALRTQPAEAGVTVKELEWRYYPDAFPSVWVSQNAAFGNYSIEETSGSDSPSYDALNPTMGLMANCEGLPEAKAAAQADYEARIRSALVPTPAPQGGKVDG